MFRNIVRYFIRKFQGYKIGYGTSIVNSQISRKNFLGNRVSITNTILEKYSYVSDESRIRDCKIGAFCSIGRNVKIGLGYHPTDYISTSPFLYRRIFLGIKGLSEKDIFEDRDYRKTIIGNDVWVGDDVIICGGCTIHDGVVIGAGSVVTKDLDSYGIYAGVPAKLIRMRLLPSDNSIPERWWEFEDAKISKIIRNYNE